MATVLRAENLSKAYANKRVIKKISLHVKTGEVVGLLGPNGAGKTTCFYMLTGLIRPDSGSIFLDDKDITNVPMYKRGLMGIGYLPQESSIFRGLNVEDNIMAILEIVEQNYNVRVQKLEQLLADFSVSHLRTMEAVRLSGGERRRVEIARALASDPKYICLDEPLAGIDPISINDIKSLISNLKTRGIGVIITDHNVREVLDIVDRAYVVYEGNILIEGSPKQILKSTKVRNIYLGENFKVALNHKLPKNKIVA